MIDRRRFLTRVTVALSGGIAALVGLPIIGYLLAPLVERVPVEYVEVGPADSFKVGETILAKYRDPSPLPWAGQLAETALWVRRRAQSGADAFQIFSVHCTHLGCPVTWHADAHLFMCPCHGGVYYSDGTVAGGPPQRPLFERAWQIKDGRLLVKVEPLPTVQTKSS